MTPISESMRGDATAAVERMAARLGAEGARHPSAGAVALAARGHAGVDLSSYSQLLGLSVDELDRIEHGSTAIGELPLRLAQRVAEVPGLDLVALCDLERALRAESADRDRPLEA